MGCHCTSTKVDSNEDIQMRNYVLSNQLQNKNNKDIKQESNFLRNSNKELNNTMNNPYKVVNNANSNSNYKNNTSNTQRLNNNSNHHNHNNLPIKSINHFNNNNDTNLINTNRNNTNTQFNKRSQNTQSNTNNIYPSTIKNISNAFPLNDNSEINYINRNEINNSNAVHPLVENNNTKNIKVNYSSFVVKSNTNNTNNVNNTNIYNEDNNPNKINVHSIEINNNNHDDDLINYDYDALNINSNVNDHHLFDHISNVNQARTFVDRSNLIRINNDNTNNNVISNSVSKDAILNNTQRVTSSRHNNRYNNNNNNNNINNNNCNINNINNIPVRNIRTYVELRSNNNYLPNYEPYLQSKNDPNFNMKENDEVVGTGILKMKGYVSEIEEEDLKKKKEDFWSSRFEGEKEIWETLRNLIEGGYVEEDIKSLLEAAGISTYAGCINVVYDANGNLYEIPNYCIHQPSSWNIEKFKLEKPKEVMIEVCIRYITTDLNLKVSNLLLCQQLKIFIINDEIYKEQNLKQDSLRLFYNGKELKDKDYLYMYNINDRGIIMMTIKKVN